MIYNLDDALKACEGRTEFAIKRADGLVLINYVVGLPDSFDGIRRDFRGIVFSEADGSIVSRPLHKFYNLGQTQDTHLSVLENKLCDVYHKLDGSMVHGLIVNGEVVLATRMGWDTAQAKDATALLDRRGLKNVVKQEIQAGFTPIFEYTGPQNPVVIDYPKMQLSYLYSRCRNSGGYTRTPGLTSEGMPILHSEGRAVGDVAAWTVGQEDVEGYVLHVHKGPWVKVKTQWYRDRHRVLDSVHLPAYKLYDLALEDKLDDLMGFAKPDMRYQLEYIQTQVAKDVLDGLDRISSAHYELMDFLPKDGLPVREHRKAYALRACAQHSQVFGGLMLRYEGQEVLNWVKDQLRSYYKSKYPTRLVPAGSEN